MAKRELSSTLKNLKFMQRAAQREEKPKKDEDVKSYGNLFPTNVRTKCMVIMEGDPHPGAVIGRMSFQSFNPSIDKLNEEAANPCQTQAPGTSSSIKSKGVPLRDNGSSVHEAGADPVNNDMPNGANGDLKRKQAEVSTETQFPKKSPKNMENDSATASRGSFKQPKREKLDWNVLRPPKGQQRNS